MSKMNLEKSLLGLAKYNNGVFKSAKQAAFFKRMCDNIYGENTLLGDYKNYYKSSYAFIYHISDDRVTKIEKHICPATGSKTSNRVVLHWQPTVQGKMTAQQMKDLKDLKRRAKQFSIEIDYIVDNNFGKSIIEDYKRRLKSAETTIAFYEKCDFDGLKKWEESMAELRDKFYNLFSQWNKRLTDLEAGRSEMIRDLVLSGAPDSQLIGEHAHFKKLIEEAQANVDKYYAEYLKYE